MQNNEIDSIQIDDLYARELLLVSEARKALESADPACLKDNLDALVKAYVELLGETKKLHHISDLQFDRLVRAQQELLEANAELERISGHDKLTGLLNRRKMAEVLDHEIQRISRSGAPGALILADIDLFKPINDNYGHLVGDEVLVQIADLLRERIRKIDYCFRWGGEEFLILLAETGFDEALAIAEDLRRELENATVFKPGLVTMSFGVAAYHEDWDQETWILNADLALYDAKRLGRNRVEGRP